MSFVNAWGPFLYATGEVDAIGYEKIMKAANATAAAVNAGHWNVRLSRFVILFKS
jgi:hypothetical protein